MTTWSNITQGVVVHGAPRVKVFRPLGPEVVEKMFISSGQPAPVGWHASPEEAMRYWPERKKEIEAGKREAAKAK